ncbi:hypothetical protein C0J52_16545 [Blattella germanica]|nr:hypothetical protein C0J52_16545 [Blattella germanica]
MNICCRNAQIFEDDLFKPRSHTALVNILWSCSEFIRLLIIRCSEYSLCMSTLQGIAAIFTTDDCKNPSRDRHRF